MQHFLQANQTHLVLIVASGVMLGLFVAAAFRAGTTLFARSKVVQRAAGLLVMALAFVFGAWITITTMMGY